MDKLNNCGVYIITNTTTSRHYIGSSKDIKARFRDHIYHLRKNNHGNKYLQRSWNKHGEGAFTFKVLKTCKSENRFTIEEFLIKKYKTNDRRRGFNLQLPSKLGGCSGFTDKEKENFRRITYNYMFKSGKTTETWQEFNKRCTEPKIKNPLSRLNKKPVYCYLYETGEFIKEYPSVAEAARDLNIRLQRVQELLKGYAGLVSKKSGKSKVRVRKSVHGYTFKYKK